MTLARNFFNQNAQFISIVKLILSSGDTFAAVVVGVIDIDVLINLFISLKCLQTKLKIVFIVYFKEELVSVFNFSLKGLWTHGWPELFKLELSWIQLSTTKLELTNELG